MVEGGNGMVAMHDREMSYSLLASIAVRNTHSLTLVPGLQVVLLMMVVSAHCKNFKTQLSYHMEG